MIVPVTRMSSSIYINIYTIGPKFANVYSTGYGIGTVFPFAQTKLLFLLL